MGWTLAWGLTLTHTALSPHTHAEPHRAVPDDGRERRCERAAARQLQSRFPCEPEERRGKFRLETSSFFGESRLPRKRHFWSAQGGEGATRRTKHTLTSTRSDFFLQDFLLFKKREWKGKALWHLWRRAAALWESAHQKFGERSRTTTKENVNFLVPWRCPSRENFNTPETSLRQEAREGACSASTRAKKEKKSCQGRNRLCAFRSYEQKRKTRNTEAVRIVLEKKLGEGEGKGAPPVETPSEPGKTRDFVSLCCWGR